MNETLERVHHRLRPTLRKVVKLAPLIATSVLVVVVGLTIWAATKATPQVLDSMGVVARKQRDTLYLATLIMLIVVIPVFVLTIYITARYRRREQDGEAKGGKAATYMPNWVSNHKLEAVWWGVPIAIIAVLSVLAYQTTHALDPYRALDSDKEAVQVQVVALQWKWLFLYPDLGIASVDEVAFPVNTPVEFTITSDAPMNSFWIPQLGGQIYAMTGMSTKLNLAASQAGDYMGVSANISGKGHAQMAFKARAMSDADYQAWLQQAQASNNALDSGAYQQLRQPSLDNKVAQYRLTDASLYDQIIALYMGGQTMEGAQH
jgi:cytochrome o ubiquinol oxidase subunit 2